MLNNPDFQTIIMSLQQFWAENGCLIWQPYYSQVGAGTMNPATFLRVLGPEPWNVAYVEPSIRPDDGRYGDNPYRMQQHYQFQVILKPDPGNPQELYLKSLQALGVDPQEHDIRFVEDNWESPALGAWGLGWEVWLDGQEITQFTYFQQAGGINLEPISVEITYGLERIAMALQGSYNFRKIQWNPDFTYGDVNYQAEREHSIYYFEEADIDRLREMYSLFEKEADLALKKGLVLPAHDYILKCSHTFNVLDTRGAIGVTERQALFGRMRDLSRRSAEAFVAQREELGFPWLEKKTIRGKKIDAPPASETQLDLLSQADLPENAEMLVEIGTEELPPTDLEEAIVQLQDAVPAMMDDLCLTYEKVTVMGTPRRLIVQVDSLASRQKDKSMELKGPPVDRAFDEDGKPSKAAIGFARSKGVEVADLKKKMTDGGEYLFADIHEKGRSISEILPERLSDLVAGIHFNKSMRWSESGVSFSRPIRWLVGLFGDVEIPFKYAQLTAGRITRGLRFSDNEQYNLEHADKYIPFLTSQGIIADSQERKSIIKKQVQKLLSSIKASANIDESILSEVNNLVEAPTSLLGNFNPIHLKLPPEVLVGVMKKHQRYFPVYDQKSALMAHFITVRNGGDKHLDVVAHGNEEVIEARFADAAFFMREDSTKKLEDFLPKLDSLIFHPKLGSMRAKSQRISKISAELSELLILKPDEKVHITGAAHLCKADLVTNLVVEMTSLQGTVGKYYALRDGLDQQVAQAIEDHYFPRQAGGQSPKGKAGLVVGLADRLDSLVGLFAVNMAPTGTKDPFGLRRAAIGLVQNLIQGNIEFDLKKGIEIAASFQPVKVSAENQQACFEFIVGRFQNMLLEDSYRYDVVNAVLAEQGANPAVALKNVIKLANWIEKDTWPQILAAFARCVRITRDLTEVYKVNPKELSMDEEKALLTCAENAEKEIHAKRTVDTLLNQVEEMTADINTFFENVLVMDKDPKAKHNRLAILQKIAALSVGLADLSQLEGF
jgi:glycyl-tRNA synthetase